MLECAPGPVHTRKIMLSFFHPLSSAASLFFSLWGTPHRQLPQNASLLYAQAGFAKMYNTTERHPVKSVVLHPHFSQFRSKTLPDYDLALVRLKDPLAFASHTAAACLPDDVVRPGVTCFVGSFGDGRPRGESLGAGRFGLGAVRRVNIGSRQGLSWLPTGCGFETLCLACVIDQLETFDLFASPRSNGVLVGTPHQLSNGERGLAASRAFVPSDSSPVDWCRFV